MDLTRRQIIAGAAATAAVAAVPFDVERFVTFVVAVTERLHPGVNKELA